jgi:nucleoside-diphosphate-sugar epimerase
MPWLQTPETFTREIAPRRGEPWIGAANLWAYLDLRDAAHVFLSALEVEVSGHVAVYVAAADTFMDDDTRSLVEAHFGEVELRAPLEGHEPLLNTRAAESLLGFRPAYSWRSYAPGVA